MFSNDKNVESITQLIEKFKHYLGLQSEFVKLDVAEKVVRLITIFAIIAISTLALMAVLLYLSISLAFALASYTGTAIAFLIVAAFYIVIFLIVVMNRKRLIERPLVRLLASILLDK